MPCHQTRLNDAVSVKSENAHHRKTLARDTRGKTFGNVVGLKTRSAVFCHISYHARTNLTGVSDREVQQNVTSARQQRAGRRTHSETWQKMCSSLTSGLSGLMKPWPLVRQKLRIVPLWSVFRIPRSDLSRAGSPEVIHRSYGVIRGHTGAYGVGCN